MNNKHLRQIISLLLLVVFCVSLFSGCSSQLPEGSSQASLDSTGSSSEATQTTKATESTYATVSSSSGVTLVDPGPVAPMDDTPRVVNSVYATCENYNFSLYSWNGKRQSFTFYMMTEKPLPSGAQITIPGIKTTYSASITEDTRERYVKLPWWLFCWWNSNKAYDIKDYAELYFTFWEYMSLFNAGKLDPALIDPETNKPYVFAEYASFDEQYFASQEEPFEEYSSNFQPEYHWYEVGVTIEEITETESFNQMHLMAGDMSRVIYVENIRLVAEEDPFPKKYYSSHLYNTGYKKVGFPWPENSLGGKTQFISGGDPWGDGIQSIHAQFLATENIYLQDAYFYKDIRCEFVKGYVFITKGQGQEIIQMEWTPGEPLLIRKGEYVLVQVLYEDPYAKLAHYPDTLVGVLEYECAGEVFSIYKCNLTNYRTQRWQTHEIYIWAFEGFDLKRYYQYFDCPMKKWLYEGNALV